MRFGKTSWRRRRAALAGVAGLASAWLGGCVEQAAEVAPTGEAARPPLERRADVSLAAATASIVSVSGAPDAIDANFIDVLRDAAHARDITLTDTKAARYLVRGYLSAAAIHDGVEVEYVWDVFGPDKRRAFRLNDVLDVKGTGDDPWSMVSDAALKSVAERSADDLAAFLSQTPEAKPAAQASANGAGVPAKLAATE